jgi:hypothetical protein
MTHSGGRERMATPEVARGPLGVDPPMSRMQQSAQSYWRELTAEDLQGFDGRAERLSNALRNRYGWSEEEIEAEIEWWEEETGNELL